MSFAIQNATARVTRGSITAGPPTHEGEQTLVVLHANAEEPVSEDIEVVLENNRECLHHAGQLVVRKEERLRLLPLVTGIGAPKTMEVELPGLAPGAEFKLSGVDEIELKFTPKAGGGTLTATGVRVSSERSFELKVFDRTTTWRLTGTLTIALPEPVVEELALAQPLEALAGVPKDIPLALDASDGQVSITGVDGSIVSAKPSGSLLMLRVASPEPIEKTIAILVGNMTCAMRVSAMLRVTMPMEVKVFDIGEFHVPLNQPNVYAVRGRRVNLKATARGCPVAVGPVTPIFDKDRGCCWVAVATQAEFKGRFEAVFHDEARVVRFVGSLRVFRVEERTLPDVFKTSVGEPESFPLPIALANARVSIEKCSAGHRLVTANVGGQPRPTLMIEPVNPVDEMISVVYDNGGIGLRVKLRMIVFQPLSVAPLRPRVGEPCDVKLQFPKPDAGFDVKLDDDITCDIGEDFVRVKVDTSWSRPAELVITMSYGGVPHRAVLPIVVWELKELEVEAFEYSTRTGTFTIKAQRGRLGKVSGPVTARIVGEELEVTTDADAPEVAEFEVEVLGEESGVLAKGVARRRPAQFCGDFRASVGERVLWKVPAAVDAPFEVEAGPIQIVDQLHLTTDTCVAFARTPFELRSGNLAFAGTVAVVSRVGGLRNWRVPRPRSSSGLVTRVPGAVEVQGSFAAVDEPPAVEFARSRGVAVSELREVARLKDELGPRKVLRDAARRPPLETTQGEPQLISFVVELPRAGLLRPPELAGISVSCRAIGARHTRVSIATTARFVMDESISFVLKSGEILQMMNVRVKVKPVRPVDVGLVEVEQGIPSVVNRSFDISNGRLDGPRDVDFPLAVASVAEVGGQTKVTWASAATTGLVPAKPFTFKLIGDDLALAVTMHVKVTPVIDLPFGSLRVLADEPHDVSRTIALVGVTSVDAPPTISIMSMSAGVGSTRVNLRVLAGSGTHPFVVTFRAPDATLRLRGEIQATARTILKVVLPDLAFECGVAFLVPERPLNVWDARVVSVAPAGLEAKVPDRGRADLTLTARQPFEGPFEIRLENRVSKIDVVGRARAWTWRDLFLGTILAPVGVRKREAFDVPIDGQVRKALSPHATDDWPGDGTFGITAFSDAPGSETSTLFFQGASDAVRAAVRLEFVVPMTVKVQHVKPWVPSRGGPRHRAVSLGFAAAATDGQPQNVALSQHLALDFVDYRLKAIRTAKELLALARVIVFGGTRDAKDGFAPLAPYATLLQAWHQLGGRAIFLANAMPDFLGYFAGQAGVDLASRGAPACASEATTTREGAAFAITPTSCAFGWAGAAEVVAATGAGPYCVRGNGVAFVEACGLAEALTREEEEFLTRLMIEMAA